MEEGIYDTIEVTAKPNVDLSEEPEYEKTYADKEFRKLTFAFPFKYNNGIEEEISAKISREGIVFNTAVSEEVIEMVMNLIITIKLETFAKVAASLQE
jgi:hypothetical protein